MIPVTRTIALHEDELRESFVRSSGPGGQHVNKTATAVQLRFDAAGSPSLPPPVRDRLLRLAGRAASAEGEIIIEASRFRSQERNRADALARLLALIRKAAHRPARRIKTRPTAASAKKRIAQKKQRGETKQLRRKPRLE
jgi:ribosome-associated protein